MKSFFVGLPCSGHVYAYLLMLWSVITFMSKISELHLHPHASWRSDLVVTCRNNHTLLMLCRNFLYIVGSYFDQKSSIKKLSLVVHSCSDLVSPLIVILYQKVASNVLDHQQCSIHGVQSGLMENGEPPSPAWIVKASSSFRRRVPVSVCSPPWLQITLR